MIAVDTNILVYAHRREMPLHAPSLTLLEHLINDSAPWAVPWPCLHEFIAVVTNPKIFKSPTPIARSFDAIASFGQGNNLHFLAEDEGYLEVLRRIAGPAHLVGAKIHDARIAALSIYHGVRELWSCDRDFSLFPELKVRNPALA